MPLVRIDRQKLSFILLLAVTSIAVANTACAEPAPHSPATTLPMTLEEARRFFVCRTHMSFDEGHGTQVFYVAPNGTEFLWYPGNDAIVTIKWRFVPRVTSVESSSQYVDWCLQFGASSYNPVTKRQGERIECRSAAIIAKGVLEHADGDVFGLSRRLPFILSRDRTSIEALQKLLRTSRPNESRPGMADDANCVRGES